MLPGPRGSSIFMIAASSYKSNDDIPLPPINTPQTVQDSPNKIGAIVGGSLGGFAALGATVFAMFLLWRRRKNARITHDRDYSLEDMSDQRNLVTYDSNGSYVQSWQDTHEPVEAEAPHGQSEINARPRIHEIAG
jgi:hypothetical protein